MISKPTIYIYIYIYTVRVLKLYGGSPVLRQLLVLFASSEDLVLGTANMIYLSCSGDSSLKTLDPMIELQQIIWTFTLLTIPGCCGHLWLAA